jgi:putative multiple sugar transport system ATP-binding protein
VKLSGGNQQKVIVSRWLGSDAAILILDEPTRGIDINAKAEIHALIAALAAEGKSIIVISSEIQELLAICDRVFVMRDGALVGEVNPATVTQEDVLRLAMFGGAEAMQQPAT